MYSTFSLYSLTVRKARSKKRPCHSSPCSPRHRLIKISELILTDFIATEIVSGYRGAQIACQWSGRNTHAVRRYGCICRALLKASARQSKSASDNSLRSLSSRTVTKKKRSERKGRRRRDTPAAYSTTYLA